jgi:hypothetical protein
MYMLAGFYVQPEPIANIGSVLFCVAAVLHCFLGCSRFACNPVHESLNTSRPFHSFPFAQLEGLFGCFQAGEIPLDFVDLRIHLKNSLIPTSIVVVLQLC